MSDPTNDLIAEVRRTFDLASQCVMLSVLDLKPESATARLGATTNPIIWQIGHLAGQQELVFHRTNGGAGALEDAVVHPFRGGSNPAEDLPTYPAFADIVDAYIQVTQTSKALLAGADSRQWTAQLQLADGHVLGGGETLLEMVRRVSLHHLYHVGCITALRKELSDRCSVGFIPGMSDEALATQQERFDTFWQARRGDYR